MAERVSNCRGDVPSLTWSKPHDASYVGMKPYCGNALTLPAAGGAPLPNGPCLEKYRYEVRYRGRCDHGVSAMKRVDLLALVAFGSLSEWLDFAAFRCGPYHRVFPEMRAPSTRLLRHGFCKLSRLIVEGRAARARRRHHSMVFANNGGEQ